MGMGGSQRSWLVKSMEEYNEIYDTFMK